ncbi:MAG TPA: Rv2175c family DNA-binding protein [Humibacillus xanthopallidus]|nr:Rv2175c family DNA-binding protein [Humibacillus xanthopallidus]
MSDHPQPDPAQPPAPAVSEASAATSQPDQPDHEAASEQTGLEALVGEWLTVPDLAERLGVALSAARRLIADRELVATRIGERRVIAVPAKFVDEAGPRPELKGTFTVLADGGMSDDEIITWLFTPDATLPVEGAPIDALRAGHKTEIRRRAQELAF